VICPTGKSLTRARVRAGLPSPKIKRGQPAPKHDFVEAIQATTTVSLKVKNNSLYQKWKMCLLRPIPRPIQEGRFAIVTNVGCGMRWT
jgi:hypothetical protein